MITLQKTADFNDISEIWEMLWQQNSELSVYQSSMYARILWQNLFPYRFILRVHPVFYVFYENGVPIMILPLFRHWFSQNYTLYGYKSGSGYLNAIYGESMDEKRFSHCFALLEEKTNIRQISFMYVRQETLLGKFLLHHGGQVSNIPCISILLPDQYESYYNGLSKSTRQNIRTAYNRLNKSGNIMEMHHYKSSKLTKKMRSELLQIYLARQTGHYKRAGGILYRLFVKWIDLGTIAQKRMGEEEDIFVLTINGQIAAYYDALIQQETVVVPRFAINEVFYTFSPGILLLNESIKWLLSNSEIRNIDLTHGEERYKIAMGGTKKYCVEAALLFGKA